MMTGTITNRRPHIELFIRGIGGYGNIEFTIDTGFTVQLTLPLEACTALQLPETKNRRTFLADGSEIDLKVYLLTVAWDGEEREVEVFALESEPLLGMTMLEGYDVLMSVAENGIVRIQKSTNESTIR